MGCRSRSGKVTCCFPNPGITISTVSGKSYNFAVTNYGVAGNCYAWSEHIHINRSCTHTGI